MHKNYAFGGSYTQDHADPTCEGLGYALADSQKLTREDFLATAGRVMQSIWTQPLPDRDDSQRTVNTIPALIAALASGWAFNADEADAIYTVFGDIRAIERGGRVIGVGTQAPDGAVIRDGRELVAWRERRWAEMRGPEYNRARCAQHRLRVVRSKGR